MTEIELKALAFVRDAATADELRILPEYVDKAVLCKALHLAIEQHEQFKREVSQMADAICVNFLLDRQVRELLTPFILPKPDHIRGAALDIGVSWGPNDSESFRAALAKRGGRIVWENEP